VARLLEEERRFQYLAQADDADLVLFTREDYDEFPDLWVADSDFEGARRITEVNPDIADFGWGTSELVEWESLDGRELQGVVVQRRVIVYRVA
jgi:dipeptidyl aminopeptidase/acylaminoacyl peptidase